MRYKILGQRTGLKVSELALGAAMFGTSSGYGAEPSEVRSILEGYVEAGGNFIDTADAYQLGESERLIGEFAAPNRNDFVIASKYSRTAARESALAALGNSRKALVQSVESSLQRLRTDRIDIYYAHFDDGVTPIDEIVRGFDDLVSAGKIIYAGLANFPAWRVAAASSIANPRGLSSIAAIQIEYSLLQRTCERELLPMADAFGLGTVGYSPLAGGRLTGKYRKGEKGRVTAMNNSSDENEYAPVLDVLIAMAAELGVTPSQAAIAWIRAKGVIPLIGPRTRSQLDDNLGALTTTLNEEHLRVLDQVSAIKLGYPHELLAGTSLRAEITGNRWELIDFPKQTVA